jgi:hypothetical protein
MHFFHYFFHFCKHCSKDVCGVAFKSCRISDDVFHKSNLGFKEHKSQEGKSEVHGGRGL